MKNIFLALAFFVPCLTYGAAGTDQTPAITAKEEPGFYIDANSKIWFCVKKGELSREKEGSEEILQTPLTDFDFIRVIMGKLHMRLIKPEGNPALRGFYVDQYNRIIAPYGKIVVGDVLVRKQAD